MCYDDDDDFDFEPIRDTGFGSWQTPEERREERRQRRNGTYVYDPGECRDVNNPDDPPPSDHTVRL